MSRLPEAVRSPAVFPPLRMLAEVGVPQGNRELPTVAAAAAASESALREAAAAAVGARATNPTRIV
jgi:hypothetical protein